MEKTLYDLLEVSRNASAEAIRANYQRLQASQQSAADRGDEDALNRLIALREALHTLTDEERRGRYDQGLASRQVSAAQSETRRLPYGILLLFVLVLGAAFAYQQQHRRQQAEQEKIRLDVEKAQAEARQAEQAAALAREERLAEERAERQRQDEAAQARASRERDIAYGNQISRNLQQAEREAQYAKLREEQKMLQAERERQLAAERDLARQKAYLRQLEAENRQQGSFGRY